MFNIDAEVVYSVELLMGASKLHYLQRLKLAHPVCSGDKFEISMLISADYYWDIVQVGINFFFFYRQNWK
jgi:hypothetical protein